MLQNSDPDPEDGFPPLNKEHVEYRWQHLVRQKTGEQRHKPLRSKVVSCHLDATQVLAELRHVELDQLSHLEVL